MLQTVQIWQKQEIFPDLFKEQAPDRQHVDNSGKYSE